MFAIVYAPNVLNSVHTSVDNPPHPFKTCWSRKLISDTQTQRRIEQRIRPSNLLRLSHARRKLGPPSLQASKRILAKYTESQRVIWKPQQADTMCGCGALLSSRPMKKTVARKRQGEGTARAVIRSRTQGSYPRRRILNFCLRSLSTQKCPMDRI